MENERREALLHNDIATLDRLLAPEFTRISSSTGDRVVARAEELAGNASGQRKVDSWEPADVVVQIYGNVGLVTGLAEVTDALGGEGRHIRFRYTHVWVKRDGRWQLVHRHTTRVATIKGPAPPH
jgi:ketosteroid isomerase-like protein